MPFRAIIYISGSWGFVIIVFVFSCCRPILLLGLFNLVYFLCGDHKEYNSGI